GRSTLFLGAAARESGATLFSLDHHRGSEENQLGWEHHDRELFDPLTGKLESLGTWRASITKGDLDQSVVGLVGHSEVVARFWQTPLDFLFIDGGHSRQSAFKDYRNWAKHVKNGGILAIHDVFENPEDGGRPPYEIYLRAKESKAFVEIDSMGSLRLLRRVAQGI
ncbi:MAG: class I SAM-dependent methyltransferase, partial [Acidimicrobiales bacterium]|nr:class I SAM-dependent methyltransferase [Acidimicrobiales bacterium]